MTRAAWQPVCVGEARHLGLEPLTPEPHLVGLQAEVADDLAAGVHHRLQLGGGRARGPHGRLVGQVVGRRAVGVGPVGRRDEDVAVLDAGVELDVGARPPPELGVEGLDDLGGLLGAGVAAGEVEHRAR